MSAALSEARAAAAVGEAADGAVAVLDEAMVARAQAQVVSTADPTAHAVVVVVREAARRLARPDLRGVVVFTAVEPCAMCVGALLESDVDRLVFAMPDPVSGAAGSVVQPARQQLARRELNNRPGGHRVRDHAARSGRDPRRRTPGISSARRARLTRR